MCSTLLVTPSSNWYSSAVTCVGEGFCASAAYNFVVLYDRNFTYAKAVLRAHSNKVTAVAAAKGDDEEFVLSGGRDKAVIAWSVKRQCVLRKQKKLPSDVTAIEVSPHDSEVAVVALGTGAVSLWKWKKGGQEHHANALSSAAAVLRSIPKRPEQQGIVLAGCDDGMIVGLDSITVTALWKVDIAAACNPRKSPVFNNSKSGPKGNNNAKKKGVQDISVTKVAIGTYKCAESSQSIVDAVLLAVTTRSCQLAVFGWPEAQSVHTSGSRPHDTPVTELHQAGEPTEELDAQPCPSPAPVDGNPGPAPSPCSRKPAFLEQLSVPPPTSEVTWLPVCWLPQRVIPNAVEAHHQVACPPDRSPCSETTDQSVSGECPLVSTTSTSINLPRQPTMGAAEGSSGVPAQDVVGLGLGAQKLCTWLLVGLPSGRMSMWRITINAEGLLQLRGPPSHPPHSVPLQDPRSVLPSASAAWRTGASDGSGAQGVSGGRSSGGGGWRRSSATEARPVKLSSDDVHARMLFTLHAAHGSTQDSNAPRSWQVISTSYDRKTVAWELSIDEHGESACMKARDMWTGTGADVLAMCTGHQVRQQEHGIVDAQALFVATGEQHMRRFRCVHVKPTHSEGIHEANPESHQPASLKLVSGSPDLFYQGISAEISAMCYVDSLIVAGCRDGTVGIVDTNLPTLKAKFSRFRLRHDGPVLACIARLSRPLQRTTVGADQDAAEAVAVEIFTLGADGNILLWRGLPNLAELHSLLRSNLGAEKIAALPAPQSLACRLPESVQQMCTFSSMELVQSCLLLGGGHGHLLVVQAPEPGEHSLNTALQAPSFELIGSTLVHTAAVTAVAGVWLQPHDTAAEHCSGDAHACRMLVVVASASGSVGILCLNQTPNCSDRALVYLAMLTDVSNAVTSLQLVPHPSFVASCSAAAAAVSDADSEASAPDGTKHSTTDVKLAEDTVVEVQKPPEWVLCACAVTDNVHMWTVSLDSQPEPTDASDPHLRGTGSKQVATYCGALKGVGHTAAPVGMRVVGGHCVTEDPAGATDGCLREPSAAAPWLVVACTDRSIRAWPVTPKLLDMHRVAKLAQQQAAAAKDAAQEPQAQPQTAPPAARATPLIACQDEAREAQPSEMVHGGAACVTELEPVAQPCSASSNRSLESSMSQQKPAAQVDASSMSTALQKSGQACVPPVPVQQSGLVLSSNDQEEVVAVHGDASLHAHGFTSEGATDRSSVLIGPQAQCESDTCAKLTDNGSEGKSSGPASESLLSNAKPQSSKEALQAYAGSGGGIERESQGSIASQLSRCVGVSKTAEVARLRPRACVLGTQSMLQGLVDDRLKHGERSFLPGTARSSVDSEQMLSDLVASVGQHEVAGKGASRASKAAAGIRNATIAAAQRVALIHLWQGDVCTALDVVVEADALNADFVAMAMGAGPEVWREVVALYAAQLAACGEIHLAAGYLCSAGDFEQAVTVYRTSGMMLEALTLAERHLAPSSSILRTLRSSLQAQLAQVGGPEPPAAVAAWGVELSIANGDVEGAVRKLVAQDGVCSESMLSRACDMLASEGYRVVAAELSCRAALGSSRAEVQKHWLQAALGQDVGVACVAAAIGIVWELMDDLLEILVSVVREEQASDWSGIVGASARSCRRFVGRLQPAQDTPASSTSIRAVPEELLQSVLSRGVDAIVGAVPQSQTPSRGGARDVAPADDSAQEQVQEVAQSMSRCVASALCCINGKELLPAHLEDLSSSVSRLLPALILSPADKSAAESVPLELAVELVAATLNVAADNQDSVDARSIVNDGSSPSGRALSAWERCAARRCSAQCSLASGNDGGGDGRYLSSGPSLQSSVWQTTVVEFYRATQPEDDATDTIVAQAPATDAAIERATIHSEAIEDAVPEECAIPVVSVLDSALQELGDLPIGAGDTEIDPSPYRTPDSAGEWTGPGTIPSPERKRKGRAGRVVHSSEAKAAELHWSEVERYQSTVQAHTPQDWAVFRQEAMVSGHAATVVATASNDAEVHVRAIQAHVQGSGAVQLEPAGGGSAVPQQRSSASTADGNDVIVEGWLGALQMHPGPSVALS